MPYAIFEKNTLFFYWVHIIAIPAPEVTRTAKLLKACGLRKRWEREARIVDEFQEKWGTPERREVCGILRNLGLGKRETEVIVNKTSTILLHQRKRVSEVFESHDLCSVLFGMKFKGRAERAGYYPRTPVVNPREYFWGPVREEWQREEIAELVTNYEIMEVGEDGKPNRNQ